MEMNKLRTRWISEVPAQTIRAHLDLGNVKVDITGDTTHPTEVKITGAATKEDIDQAVSLVERLLNDLKNSNII